MKYECAIFDLDGVIVDTAKYHYFAWAALAKKLNINFTIKHNELLKGISREESLEVLLGYSGLINKFTREEKNQMMEEKNQLYLSYIEQIGRDELLEGALCLLETLRNRGVKIVLGSASKNAPLIMSKLGIETYFDVIVDGNLVKTAKPDPEVFIFGADKVLVPYEKCVVFEDSVAGIQAALASNMFAVGIGTKEDMPLANEVISNLSQFDVDRFFC